MLHIETKGPTIKRKVNKEVKSRSVYISQFPKLVDTLPALSKSDCRIFNMIKANIQRSADYFYDKTWKHGINAIVQRKRP